MDGDWNAFPMTDITKGCDFVQGLLQGYLDDLGARRKLQDFGTPPVAVTIRKSVRLDEVESVIEQV